jgi:hypothetical protein
LVKGEFAKLIGLYLPLGILLKVTLETYSHALPSMQEEAARKLDELIKLSDRDQGEKID